MISDGNEAMGLRRLTHFSTRYPPRSFFVDRRTASKSVYSRPLGGENNRCRPSGRPVVGYFNMRATTSTAHYVHLKDDGGVERGLWHIMRKVNYSFSLKLPPLQTVQAVLCGPGR